MTRKPFDPSLIQAPPTETRPPALDTSHPASRDRREATTGEARSDASRVRSGRAPVTVSQVTAMVKRAIEQTLPATIHVIGEISNFKRHSSGHLYLTLKDGVSELSCVMWRSAAAKLKFTPADGLEVIATGSIEVFERAGRYQLYIRTLEPRGVGALELAFRQLCEKLDREGLFDEKRKKPLPPYPSRIALVTSPTGAAVADMLRTLERRYPCVHVLVCPVRVQGPGAAEEIAASIRRVNEKAVEPQKAVGPAFQPVDVMIVGRGGGSLEDLWAFNEETVARAIHASRIPIISAVGHEVDVSIADLTADVRAATPTAAAELAVPVLDEVLADVDELQTRMTRTLQGRVDVLEARCEAVLQRSPYREPLAVVHRREQHIDELVTRVQRSLFTRLHTVRRALDRVEPILQRIAPHAYLARTSVQLQGAEHGLRWSLARRLAHAERDLTDTMQRLTRAGPATRIPRRVEQVQRIAQALPAAMGHRLSLLGEHLQGKAERLGAMSYRSVLGRGFSITRTRKGRKVVRSLDTLDDSLRLTTELADGEFESEVVNLKQLELFD